MKALVCSILLLVAVPVLAVDDVKEAVVEAPVIVVERADGEGAEPVREIRVFSVAGDQGTPIVPGQVVVSLAFNEDSGDANLVGTAHVVAQVHISDEGREDRAWLGVFLDAVSVKEARENNIDGGVRIINVIKDSPAAAAGLERGDIIASINGQDIAAGMSELTKVIGDLGPGSEARIGVIRDGQSLELTATLSKPQSGSVQLLGAPDVDFADHFAFGPNVWRFQKSGEDGAFVIDENFAWQQLPKSLRNLANLNTQFDVRFGDGGRVVNMKSVEDGDVLAISQEGDGPIMVKRYVLGHEDEAEEAEYANADVLKVADEAAFKLYNQHGARSVIMFRSGENGTTDVTLSADQIDFIREGMAAKVEALLEASGETDESIQSAIAAARSTFGGGVINLPNTVGVPAPRAMFIAGGKAMQSFRVNPDGEIEVTIRKGDTEIVNVYSDQADLEARNPEAFEKYRSLLDSVNE